jgi:hypothetical protein
VSACEGATWKIRLRWSLSGPAIPAARLRLQAIHSDQRVVGQVDDLLGTAFYPPMAWTAGSVIAQQLVLAVPGGGATPVKFRLSLADATTRESLKVRESILPVREDGVLFAVEAEAKR